MQNQQKQGLYPIARARLGVDPSQLEASIEAAARCTADWPTAEQFARQFDPEAAPPQRWDSDRMDSDDSHAEVVRRRKRRRGIPFATALIHRDGADPQVIESEFRLDGAVASNPRVADAAVSVLQAMRSIASCWDQMDLQTRGAAQLAVGAGRRFLRQAGIRSVAG